MSGLSSLSAAVVGTVIGVCIFGVCILSCMCIVKCSAHSSTVQKQGKLELGL